jgi:hypothetical protein
MLMGDRGQEVRNPRADRLDQVAERYQGGAEHGGIHEQQEGRQ